MTIQSIERVSTHVFTCRNKVKVEEVTVIVELDIDRLVALMATRAWRTKTGTATLQGGLVTARIVERRPK